MNYNLPADLDQFAIQQITAGNYSSMDELVNDAVRLLRDLREKQDQLAADVAVGLEQSRNGLARPLDFEALVQRWTAELADEGIRD